MFKNTVQILTYYRDLNNLDQISDYVIELLLYYGLSENFTKHTYEAYLKELMEKYHLGGCRYNNMPAVAVQNQNAILQKYAKIPLIIACNTEAGGDGGCSDGTFIGSNMNEAVAYFNNPNNASIKTAYENKLKLI